jgi:DNA adenine methylase
MRQYVSSRGRFIELFAGSAAVFFDMEPERAVLVDVCGPLIAFYEAIQREPDAFCDEIDELLKLPFGKETYYDIRDSWNGRDFGVKFAARLMYLNKLCFNGLFRLNQSLKFNSPWGKKPKMPAFPPRSEISRASQLLSRAKLYHRDFSNILRAAHAGDVVYADPPYWGTFDGYAGKIFREQQQRKLAGMLARASDRGVTIFASNIDCEEVRDLYSWADIETVPVLHSVGASKESRRKVSELLISATTSYIDRNQLNLFEATHEANGLQA